MFKRPIPDCQFPNLTTVTWMTGEPTRSRRTKRSGWPGTPSGKCWELGGGRGGGSTPASPSANPPSRFWEILGGWSDEQRAKFLQFVTGTSQVPLGGFSRLAGHLGEAKQFELKWVQYNDSTFRYPRAHTCMNRLDIPAYPTKDEMKLCVEGVLNIDFECLRFGLE